MTNSVINCECVTKRFGDIPVVDRVSFDLQPGEIISLLGPSGCGKTTLLRLIAGFEEVDSGRISILGRAASSQSNHLPPEQRNIGMVFQEYALFPHMTVGENIAFGLQSVSNREKDKRLTEVLELVRLKGLEERYPHELSGGQQQRVALARTLAPQPIAVLLDEPFSNLDASMRMEMRQEVESILKGYEIAAIFVTHDRDEAFAMADRIGVMSRGRIEQLGSPESIYGSPANIVVAQLTGSCDFINGIVQRNTVVTEIGRLSYTSGNGILPEGSRVELLLRLDDLALNPDDNGRAVIESKEFRGGETTLVVRLPSGSTIRCRQIYQSGLDVGNRVNLTPTKDAPFLAFKT